jgi:putative transposase
MTPNRSSHVYAADAWYMITASTVRKQRLLATDAHLRLWTDVLRSLTEELDLTLSAWVVLPNHYHVLLKASAGSNINVFVERLHGRSSFLINKRDSIRSRHVWYNHWDTPIRSDDEQWTCVNSIHENPVKHGFARDRSQWAFSSYAVYLRSHGAQWLSDSLERYSVAAFIPDDDF